MFTYKFMFIRNPFIAENFKFTYCLRSVLRASSQLEMNNISFMLLTMILYNTLRITSISWINSEICIWKLMVNNCGLPFLYNMHAQYYIYVTTQYAKKKSKIRAEKPTKK